MILEDNHVFQGMRRDNHQITQDSKFLWDARNIRITNREDNTLFAITNEKGTSLPLLYFEGCYIGHCVLGKYLVVFTTTEDTNYTRIYRVEKNGDSFKTIILFQGEINISATNPLETIGCYETDLIQKVYWVDGINQPRVINIAKPELKLPKNCIVDGVNLQGVTPTSTNYEFSTDQGINDTLINLIPDGLYNTNSFDFIRELALKEIVDVKKIYGQGEFSSGTIQYAFSYYNKYEQESNIFYITPLYYASPIDRGGNPEEKVACSFKITIGNPDKNFDFIRIYSIHRTSIDAVPTVKIVEDISTKDGKLIDDVFVSTELSYIDTGTIGSIIEPSQLLYIGGETIVANCIEQKDNTLFLGNITQKGGEHFEEISNTIKENNNYWELDDWIINSSSDQSESSVYYNYTPDLSSGYRGAFKSGETYRLGLQVQYSNGKWSEPIYLTDQVLTNIAPWHTLPQRESKAVRIFRDHKDDLINKYSIRKIRTCVVFPRTYERDVLCQGILCPTVYSVSGRRNNTLYSMSSWFFRPATQFSTVNYNVYKGANIQYKHNYALFTGANEGTEIQSMQEGASTLADVTSSNIDKYNSHFFVDENIVTFHSPDIEFDTNLINSNFDEVSLRIIGMAKLGAIYGDIDIQTSAPPIDAEAPGFIHSYIGYQTKDKNYINGGLIAAPFYKDATVNESFNSGEPFRYWMIYPWHRSGSLNNDSKRPTDKGTRSAVLFKKKMSNLKFFNINKSISPLIYNISTPQVFNSNEVSLLKITPAHLDKEVNYFGNVDILISSNNPYPLYGSDLFTNAPTAVINNETTKYIAESSEPVRIKYKSAPHLVFSLGNEYNKIQLLPRAGAIENAQNGNFNFPDWEGENSGNTYKGKYDYLVGFCTETEDYNLYSPERFKSGDILIGKAKDPRQNGYYIFYLNEYSPEGNVWKRLKTEYNGKIVKFTANHTIKSTYDSSTPFGTSSTDWFGTTYIGTDKFYQLNIEKREDGLIYNTITDITEHITTSPNTPSRTLVQQTFHNTVEDGYNTEDGYPYLLIGELVRDNIINKFGGNTEEALKQNLWIPAGRPVEVDSNINSDIIVPFEYGDTWYSRYDCLKTYPFTQEDENSVVEIGSFMCETRVNIDGRYDKNRGQLSNLTTTPQNFNKLNEVYSQKDTFFPYRILDKDYYKQHIFSNQVTWSKQKNNGEDVDTWTNITLASTLDLDGDKGSITAIKTLNDDLLCFQEKAFNQLMFNSRVQIPVSDGVPVEISNGLKMSDSRILNDTIGCNNKWSIIKTPSYLYFIDSNTDSLYAFNGKLTNVSGTTGMTWWLKENNINSIWNPTPHDLNGIRSFYDSKYNDVYFTPGLFFNKEKQPDALCYSEKLEQFNSLMSYGGTQAMFNFEDSFYSLRGNDTTTELYENNVGEYNSFFGEYKGWSFSFISNDKPNNTKVFNNIELRMDHYFTNGNVLLDTCPINYIKVMNEYQKGESIINNVNMKKKFRVWRGFIPRHNGTMQRIRNPWAMITLGWNPVNPDENMNNKAVIHDVSVKYSI